MIFVLVLRGLNIYIERTRIALTPFNEGAWDVVGAFVYRLFFKETHRGVLTSVACLWLQASENASTAVNV